MREMKMRRVRRGRVELLVAVAVTEVVALALTWLLTLAGASWSGVGLTLGAVAGWVAGRWWVARWPDWPEVLEAGRAERRASRAR